MEVIKRFFPEHIPDNEEVFISHICGIIESIDEFCNIQISRFPTCYHFRLATSLPKYNNILLQEITAFNNKFGIKLDISKSIKTTAVVAFQINLN